MIFNQVFRREFSQTALMALLVLVAILFTVTVVKLLGLAAGGELSGDAVAAMVGFGILTYLPVIMSASVFTAVLMTLTRAYRDSEMIIWLASGVSLTRFLIPVMAFAIPMALIVSLMSVVISPWATGQKAIYQKRLDSQDDTSQITPGVFRESKQSDQVFFVDSINTNKKDVSNVFVQSIQENKVGVIAAEKGFVTTKANGDRFVVLQKGRRYEGKPGTANYNLVDFDEAQLRIQEKAAGQTSLSVKSMPITQLMTKPTLEQWSEFNWRIGLPISLIILCVFAIPLSYINTRAGRSANMVFALLAYMVYYNTMGIGQSWIVQGKVSPWVGIWPIHLGFFLVAFFMLIKRQWLWSVKRLFIKRQTNN
ncbi:MAG: LPS export ABC transporter permease LptF [Betaproteobacteria bacterium]|nr:LPS export ABC transporter permease LptF [Betaproteobacteria bacterium]MDE2055824.1 LPS export ABC transporter permease LptF [Betaproteobacteria bacterium]